MYLPSLRTDTQVLSLRTDTSKLKNLSSIPNQAKQDTKKIPRWQSIQVNQLSQKHRYTRVEHSCTKKFNLSHLTQKTRVSSHDRGIRARHTKAPQSQEHPYYPICYTCSWHSPPLLVSVATNYLNREGLEPKATEGKSKSKGKDGGKSGKQHEPKGQEKSDKSNKQCFKCSKAGHYAKDCWSKVRVVQNSDQNQGSTSSAAGSNNNGQQQAQQNAQVSQAQSATQYRVSQISCHFGDNNASDESQPVVFDLRQDPISPLAVPSQYVFCSSFSLVMTLSMHVFMVMSEFWLKKFQIGMMEN